MANKKNNQSSKSNKVLSDIHKPIAARLGFATLTCLFLPFAGMLATDSPVHAWQWIVDYCDHRIIPHLIVTTALLWMYEKVKQRAIELAM